jgi:hypothetical protein
VTHAIADYTQPIEINPRYANAYFNCIFETEAATTARSKISPGQSKLPPQDAEAYSSRNTPPAPGNPSIKNMPTSASSGRTVTFGQQSTKLCWPVRVPCSEGIARDRLRCRLFQLGWRGCQCVGFVPRGGGALGSRLQRWRCSSSFHSDTSISKSSQATPSSLARRRPRRPRRSKIGRSIPRTRQTTFARSARLSI